MRESNINFLVKVSSFESKYKTEEEWREYYEDMDDERLEVLRMLHGTTDSINKRFHRQGE